MNIWPIFDNDDHACILLTDWAWKTGIVTLIILMLATTKWNMRYSRSIKRLKASNE